MSRPAGEPAGHLGTRLTLLALAIGMAAVNTGNNLLYLVLSLVLSLAAVAWLVSSWSLRRLRVSAALPEEVVRGEPFVAAVEATGRFPFLPQTWLDVAIEGLPDPVVLAVPIPCEAGRGVASARAVAGRRGLYEGLSLSVATGYPFDLWRRRARRVAWRGSLTVLPDHPVLRALRVVRAAGSRGGGPAPAAGPARSGIELHDLRPHDPADDARRIEWRSTARAGRLMARSFDRETERRLDLALDLESESPEAFEAAVGRCAAILDLARREGFDARLLLPGCDAPLTGRSARRALAAAAPAGPGGARGARRALEAALRLARPGAEMVVVSADPARGTPVEME